MTTTTAIRFTTDDRGHRRFAVHGLTYRAFWSPFNRRWTVKATDPTTGENAPEADDRRWHFKNWPELERHAERVLPRQVDLTERLAAQFLRDLQAVLTEDEYRQACLRNATERDPLVCHTHDFCDANEVMAGAFDALGLTLPEPDEDQALWNGAWALAFRRMAATGIAVLQAQNAGVRR